MFYPEYHTVSVDEGADFITRQYGLPLTRVGLLEVCDDGWKACRLDGQGRWTIDPAKLTGGDAPRELAERVERLAVQRQEAEGAMTEPPAGAEAGEDI